MHEVHGAAASVREEEIELRSCRRCGWEGPAQLGHCRRCPGALGEPFERRIVVVTPAVRDSELPELIAAVAVVAIELSGPPWSTGELCGLAGRIGSLLELAAGAPALLPLRSGVVACVFWGDSLRDSATLVARLASDLPAPRGRQGIELRAGMASGLLDGARPGCSAAVRLAERFARAAQPGQTLATLPLARLLEREWDFAPAGLLPRRGEDPPEAIPTTFRGRKTPVLAPSALVSDDGQELVGRERELEILDTELERALAGESRWCAVIAPAGAGKSKLLRAWLARKDGGRFAHVAAAASPFGAAPLALAAELCRSARVELPPEASPRAAGDLLAAASQRFRDGCIVLVEDIHWADRESLQTLQWLAAVETPGVLVVAALRDSFVAAIPWVVDRARSLRLPGLAPYDRELLARRLLPGTSRVGLVEQLAHSELGANPLYVEQCAAYVREGGKLAELPRSLHEIVLRRLELLLRALHRPHPLSPREIEAVERTVGEWLDRLETNDYESRAALAEYLALLEHIDVELVIASHIAGAPLARNRRLSAAVERFYSATFSERVQAIERLAEHDRPNAAHASTQGADRALRALRLDDAICYLDLAARLSVDGDRPRHLLRLGDVLLTRGRAVEARGRLEDASWASNDPAFRARCERRVARVAIGDGKLREARSLLEHAMQALEGDERAIARADLAYARAELGEPGESQEAPEPPGLAPAVQRLLRRTALRVAIRRGLSEARTLAERCGAALVFTGDPAWNAAELVETTALLVHLDGARVSPALRAEAERAAARLGSDAARRKLEGREPGWRPIHPCT